MSINNQIIKYGLTGLALTLPFIILELINNKSFPNGFPFMLFFVLWLLAAVLSRLVGSVYSGIRHKSKRDEGVWILTGKSVLMLVILTALIFILHDQMPCFLGMGNCD